MTTMAAPAAQVLSEDEEILVGRIEEWLSEQKPHDIPIVQDRFQRLKKLGDAVFDYPSIRNIELFSENLDDERGIIESLRVFSSSSHLLRTPTKVVALRSFLVAKFHAFSLLSQLTFENSEFYLPLKNIVFSIICTLMAEDVYF